MQQNDDILEKTIYNEERNGFGHTIVLCQSLDSIKPSSALKDAAVTHIVQRIADSLDISKRYGNTRSYVHIYMGGCLLKHYSIGFYKRLFKKLDNTYEDTLEAAYVYDPPTIAECTWDILKIFVDPCTRSKVHMISSTCV